METSVETLCRELGEALERDDRIAALYLFGSRVRGTASRLSDTDIGILLCRAVERSAYFDLRLHYITRAMTLLGTDRVDIVLLNEAPIHLAFEIVSRGVLLLERNREQRVAFEADRIGRYLDMKPFFEMQIRATKEQLSRGTFFD